LPRLQTFDGPQLDALLAQVRREAGADARIVQARKIRSGGFGGFFSKERFRVDVEHVEPVEMTDDAAPASLLELADLVDAAEVDAVSVTVPTVRPPEYVPSTERPTFHAVLDRIAREAGAPPSSPFSVAPAGPEPANATKNRELLALGLPESMLPADMSPGMAVARLLQSLDLPAAPPLPFQPGAVTVVVGDRRAAARLATDLAGDLLLTKRDVWIAEEAPHGRTDRLSTPADAAAERRTWLGGPNVVALTAPAGGRDLRWAEAMLDALEPSAVWGVVGADRKPEDIAAWSDALGGLDALAVEHLDLTVSPASVLRLGIPVARLDGQKATPALWAVLLAERLAA